MKVATLQLRRRAVPRWAVGRRQQGLVMLVVLMVLGLMFLGAAGAMRAVDTGNVISGNFSFQQAAVQASDRAVKDAMNTLSAAVAAGGGNAAIANRYYNVRQSPVDSRGFPSATNWNNVNCVDEGGSVVGDCSADAGNYRVQYVIERMCAGNPDMSNINDIRARCEYEASATALSASTIALRYRVVVRVRGPRGTEGWFEAMVSGPAST